VDPLRVRNKVGNPWVATEEAAFRKYALDKMRQDAGFRKRVEGLRGKNLLCWCEQDGPKREKFCHARVWLEVANRVLTCTVGESIVCTNTGHKKRNAPAKPQINV
jgi:uncharacterized protein DUF4326